MKSTPIFKILEAALLVAILLYFSIQAVNYFSDTMKQSEAYASACEDTITLNGWLVRDEETFSSAETTLSHPQSEGAKVGVGQTLAVVYQDAASLAAVDKIQSLELRLEQLEFARNSFLDPDAVLKLDSMIQSDLLSVCRFAAGGDFRDGQNQLTSLKAAILKRDNHYSSEDAIEADIVQVKQELSALRASLQTASSITASQSGTYSANCDGYETVLTPDFLADVTPEKLAAPVPASVGSNVGKLIYGDTWYYASVISDEDVARLGNRSTVTFRFSKGFLSPIEMQVDRIVPGQNGQNVLILSCRKYLSETTVLRYQSADIILHTYEGLRVNSNALRIDQEGHSGVYCAIGATARFKPVDIVYEGQGFVLVTPSPSAQEDPNGVIVLRPGDQVITSAGELFNGKVIY